MMRVKKFFLFLVMIVLCLDVFAQNTRDSICSICFNEIYVYKSETDSFKYKKGERIAEWIEIYNNSFEVVHLEELYLTDDITVPQKYPIFIKKIKYSEKRPGRHQTIYINGTGRRSRPMSQPDMNAPYLFLIRKRDGAYQVEDTLKQGLMGRFPISRYPDGEDFKYLDALTPRLENAYKNESMNRKVKGFTFQLGTTTAHSHEFGNTTRYAPSFTIGLYSRKNLALVSLERGFRFAVRGYGVRYQSSQTLSKGIREIDTRGNQRTFHLDYFYMVNLHLSKKISFYYGNAISIRLGGRLKYDQKTTFTYFSSGSQVKSDTTYLMTNYDDAINFLDYYLVLGMKYHFDDKFDLSLCYIRDIVALNGNFNKQVSSGIYFTLEVPFMKTRYRIKRKNLF